MPRNKLAEAQTVFGLYPEGGAVDEQVIEAAKPIVAGMAQPGVKATIDALRPVVLDAVSRRQHTGKLESARHNKKGRYGFPRSTIKTIREEVDRRGAVPGSSIWKEAIEYMRSRADSFRFEFVDGADASGAVHGTKSPAGCAGVRCILIDLDGTEHEISIQTLGQYLKLSR